MFHPGMSVFSFDLKSAYHHIEICEEHRKFFSFKWPSPDGIMKFYEFKVLPFGLSSGLLMSSPKWFVNWLNTGEVVAILF